LVHGIRKVVAQRQYAWSTAAERKQNGDGLGRLDGIRKDLRALNFNVEAVNRR
jgi:hypothetical protein